MRKKVFLWLVIILTVLLLILAFENIFAAQTYYLLFYQVDASSTIMILFAAALGFLIGFFLMLFGHEISKEKAPQKEVIPPEAKEPVSIPTQEPQKAAPKSASSSQKRSFDDDEEVLG